MVQSRSVANTFVCFTRPRIQKRCVAGLNALNLNQTFIRRTGSIVTGHSGRDYATRVVLRKWSHNHELNIYRVDSQGQSFVVNLHLRMHVDYNAKDRISVYEYFSHTFLALLSYHPEFPSAEIKKILRGTAAAVQELYGKDWIHIDIKPDNILVDWAKDEEGRPVVQKVALDDFDLALKLIDDQPLRLAHAVGNVMWRSPEGQSGKGVAKASDVFSLGLVCIYGLGGGGMLILSNDSVKALKKAGVPPAQKIVVRHFMFFGPLPEGLLRHIDDPEWTILFQEASQVAKNGAKENPELRFERWPVENAPDLTSDAKDMITKMMVRSFSEEGQY